MRLAGISVIAALAAVGVAQSLTNQSVILSTSLSTVVGPGADHQLHTSTTTLVFTITPTPLPTPAGNSSVSASGNSTITGASNATSSPTTTTPTTLPTAPSVGVDGGGSGGAPLPGATGVGGAYGPDDDYIAAASSLKLNTLLLGAASFVIGAALLAF